MTGLASEDDEVLMAFATQPPKTSHPQRSLLAIVMLAIMLGCVGWAWYIVQSRTVLPENNAKAILADIRSRKLKFYWGDQSERLFYIIETQNRPISWQGILRRPTQDGYVGGKFEGEEEFWQLNADATEGKYMGPLSLVPGDKRKVQILLNNQKLEVAWLQDHQLGNAIIAKTSPVEPLPNYIPEGLMDLVLHLVAASGRPAVFHTVLNDESILKGRPNFAFVRMEPEGQVIDTETFGLEGLIVRERYVLDDKGTIVQKTLRRKDKDGEQIYQFHRASLEDLIKIWPDDPVLRKLAEQTATQESQEVETSATLD